MSRHFQGRRPGYSGREWAYRGSGIFLSPLRRALAFSSRPRFFGFTQGKLAEQVRVLPGLAGDRLTLAGAANLFPELHDGLPQIVADVDALYLQLLHLD